MDMVLLRCPRKLARREKERARAHELVQSAKSGVDSVAPASSNPPGRPSTSRRHPVTTPVNRYCTFGERANFRKCGTILADEDVRCRRQQHQNESEKCVHPMTFFCVCVVCHLHIPS
ncbi:hypothetical protein ANCCAN_28809 [Ancylostoma caninum]|uniref:Uncharacterized protein n=1 Tax=Ancylostoma caninum TaxID=29170 RepID=A0A368F1G0_ANCCA|nr:hypothetical protein ANCCAN_28809 [Ancylostoma caninum]